MTQIFISRSRFAEFSVYRLARFATIGSMHSCEANFGDDDLTDEVWLGSKIANTMLDDKT